MTGATAAPRVAPEERQGTTLDGKYRLDRILGRGGFGVVYEGVHEWTGREVAAKLLRESAAQDPETVQRFLREARAAARLEHPNVVDVLDMGQTSDGIVYMVLERLVGEDLRARLDRVGALGLAETFELLLPIMDALGAAHELGIVHRDLKPSNIFLAVGRDGRITPKLLDFGIAKLIDSTTIQTAIGRLLGTPKYMSRERLVGGTAIGPASDVWSMAVVLWRCLAGTTPFEADGPHAILARVVAERAAPIASVVPALRGPIADVIDRALDPSPDARYPDMRAFREACVEALTQARPPIAALAPPVACVTLDPTVCMPAPAPPPAQRAEKARGLPIVFGGVLLAGVATGAFGLALFSPGLDPAAEPEAPAAGAHAPRSLEVEAPRERRRTAHDRAAELAEPHSLAPLAVVDDAPRTADGDAPIAAARPEPPAPAPAPAAPAPEPPAPERRAEPLPSTRSAARPAEPRPAPPPVVRSLAPPPPPPARSPAPATGARLGNNDALIVR